MRDATTGRFVPKPDDPDDWSQPLVWVRAYPDAPPVASKAPKKPAQIIKVCECCSQDFDALERAMGNVKTAEMAKYCSQTCAKRAAKQRERGRARENVVGGVVGVVSRETLPLWERLKREDVE